MSVPSKSPIAGILAEQEMLLPEGFDASLLAETIGQGDGDLLAADDDAVVLQLGDLVPDEQGEIVVFNDIDAPIHLAVADKVVASGTAEPHVTAAGIDVTGMHFSMLDSGVTVYHDPEVNLTFG